MKCAVCNAPGAKPVTIERGDTLGNACHECCGLLWLAFFGRTTGDAYEAELVLWLWRQRRAHVRGEEFRETMPRTEAEAILDRWIRENGLEAVARELS